MTIRDKEEGGGMPENVIGQFFFLFDDDVRTSRSFAGN